MKKYTGTKRSLKTTVQPSKYTQQNGCKNIAGKKNVEDGNKQVIGILFNNIGLNDDKN